MTLQSIDPNKLLNQNKRQALEPPPVTCEHCGKVVARRDDAINIIINVGSPGHRDIPPFQCSGDQSYGDHWFCSLDCWQKGSHACIDQHLFQALVYVHSQKPESIHHQESKRYLS